MLRQPIFKVGIKHILLTILAGLNLRTVLAALGAGTSYLEADFGGGGAVAGSVSTIFIVLIAVGSPVVLGLRFVFSVGQIVISGIVLILISSCLFLISTSWVIWLVVLSGGLGAGLIGTVFPVIVRILMPTRQGIGITLMMIGSAGGFYLGSVSVGFTVKFGHAWRYSAIPLIITAFIALLTWLFWRPSEDQSSFTTDRVRFRFLPRNLNNRWARISTVYLGAQSFVLFAQIAWIVPILESHNIVSTVAGAMLGAVSGFQLVTGIFVPLAVERHMSIRLGYALGAVALALGSFLLLAMPLISSNAALNVVAWSAVSILGLGHGTSFALVNYVVARYSQSYDAAVEVGASVMFVSQLCGAFGPAVFGLLRDWKYAYHLPIIVLCGLGAIMIYLGIKMPGKAGLEGRI